jgi:hypothetical protein
LATATQGRLIVEKALVAQRVANRLFATENAVDAAILESSQLMAAFMEARQEIGFAATLGGEAVNKVAAAMSALAEARQACVEAHNELSETKLRLNIRTRMDGTGPKGYAGETAEVREGLRIAS